MPLVNAGLVVLPIADAAGHAPPATLVVTGSPIVSDSFNRANSSTAVGAGEIGTAPTALGGTWGISSNLLYKAVGSGGWDVVAWDAGVADVQMDIDLASDVGNIAVAFRVQDGSNFYLVNQTAVYKCVAGAFTSLQTLSPTGFANGDHLTIQCTGSSIVVLKNQVQVASLTDSTYTTQTKFGAVSNQPTGGSGRWDNLKIATKATLYTDRTKATAIGSTMQKVDGLCPTVNNTVYCDVDGVARFYATPGLYSAVKTVNGVQSAPFSIPVPPDPIELASKF
jgi:hypothetical protein